MKANLLCSIWLLWPAGCAQCGSLAVDGSSEETNRESAAETNSNARESEDSNTEGVPDSESHLADTDSSVPETVEASCENDWCKIPAGDFVFGSPDDDPRCRGPLMELETEVKLTKGFFMLNTEVTREQWLRHGGHTQPFWDDSPGMPANMVSWFEALKFCNNLSEAQGLEKCYSLESCTGTIGESTRCNEWKDFCRSSYTCSESVRLKEKKVTDCRGYRLPTVAEWEYAARAGTNTDNFGGDVSGALGDCPATDYLDEISWYCGNAKSPMPVGKKRANPFGLFDVIGNVCELVDTSSHGASLSELEGSEPPLVDPIGPDTQERIHCKGSSYLSPVCVLTSSHPSETPPNAQAISEGFRLVRTIFDEESFPPRL